MEQDINSLTSFTTKKTKDYGKNRVLRVYDTFMESLYAQLPAPTLDNNDTGWDSMDGTAGPSCPSSRTPVPLHHVDLMRTSLLTVGERRETRPISMLASRPWTARRSCSSPFGRDKRERR